MMTDTEFICIDSDDEDEVQLIATIVNIDCPPVPKIPQHHQPQHHQQQQQQQQQPQHQQHHQHHQQQHRQQPHQQQQPPLPRQSPQPPPIPTTPPLFATSPEPEWSPPWPTTPHQTQASPRPPTPPAYETQMKPATQQSRPATQTRQEATPPRQEATPPRPATSPQPASPPPLEIPKRPAKSPRQTISPQPTISHLLVTTPQPATPPSKSMLNEKMVTLKELGNEKFRRNLYSQAINDYKQAYAIAMEIENREMSAILHFNLAQTYAKLGSLSKAIDECAKATKINDNYLKAHLKRGEIYMRQNMFDEAVICYNHVCEIDPDSRKDYAIFLNQAEEEATKYNKRKDHYQRLGLKPDFSKEDLKRAYRERALKHHPDRHSDTDVVTRKIEEKKFKDASEAYKILSDPRERNKYDHTLYSEQRRSAFLNPYSRFASRVNERSFRF